MNNNPHQLDKTDYLFLIGGGLVVLLVVGLLVYAGFWYEGPTAQEKVDAVTPIPVEVIEAPAGDTPAVEIEEKKEPQQQVFDEDSWPGWIGKENKGKPKK